jgi:hypothetical protein
MQEDLQSTVSSTSTVTGSLTETPIYSDVYIASDKVSLASQLSGTGVWQDVDVSALVPAGSIGVVVEVTTGTGDSTYGLRRKGSTDEMLFPSGTSSGKEAFVGLDSKRVFQFRRASANTSLKLVGAFGPNSATFHTNAVQIAAIGAGATGWSTHTFSPDVAGEPVSGVIVQIVLSGTQQWAVRREDTANFVTPGPGNMTWVMCQVKRENDGQFSFQLNRPNTNVGAYIVGYTKLGLIYNPTFVDVEPALENTWQDAAAVPSDPPRPGGMVTLAATSGTPTTGQRRKGSSDNFAGSSLTLTMLISQVDSDRIAQTFTNSRFATIMVRVATAYPLLGMLFGRIASTSAVTGLLRATVPLGAVTVTSASTVTGSLTRIRGLQSTVSSISAVTGSLTETPIYSDIYIAPDKVDLSSQLSGTNVWQDVDVSKLIPAGAIGVIVEVFSGAMGAAWGLRKKGSTDEILASNDSMVTAEAFVGIDANGVFQLRRSLATLTIKLVGSFGPGSANVFTDLTTVVANGAGTTDWTTYTFDPETPGEPVTGVILRFVPSGYQQWNLRRDPSASFLPANVGLQGHAICAVARDEDTGQYSFQYIRSTINGAIYMVGYTKLGFMYNMPYVNVEPGVAGSFVDAPAVPSDPPKPGGMVTMVSSTGLGFMAQRRKGSSDTNTGIPQAIAMLISQVDENGVAQTFSSNLPATNMARIATAYPTIGLLFGRIESVSSVTGSLQKLEVLQSTVTSTSTVTGSLQKLEILQSTVTSTSAVVGFLSATVPLGVVTVTETSVVTGVLTATVPLGAVTVTTNTTVTGFLSATVPLGAVTVTGTSTVTCSLIVMVPLAVSVTSASTVTGFLRASARMTSTVTSTSAVTGFLRSTVPLVVTVTSTSTVTGTLTVAESMAVFVISTSAVTGTLYVFEEIPVTAITLTASEVGEVGQSFTIFEGESRPLLFSLYDREGGPIVIDNIYDIVWQAQRNFDGAPDAVITKSLGYDIILCSGTNRFFVLYDSDETEGLLGSYIHQLALYATNATVIGAEGTMTVNASPWA